MGTGIGITGPCGGGGGVTTDAWVRNPDWIAIPDVALLENRLYGVYAIYENGPNELVIQIGGNGGTLDWGDGTSTGILNLVVYTKAYDYATIAGAISVDTIGRNYKQVLVDIIFPVGCYSVNLERNAGGINYPTGWLDINASMPDASTFQIAQQRKSIVLERVRIIDSIINSTNSTYQYLANLSVWDVDFGGAPSNLQGTWSGGGDLRDNNNNPLNLDFPNITFGASTFNNSRISKIGNIDWAIATTMSSVFSSCASLRDIGSVNIPLMTTMVSTFSFSASITSVGTITTSAALTSLQNTFYICSSLRFAIFTDCSSVTNTTNTLGLCTAIEDVIMPGLTVGIIIINGKMSTASLDAFFTSLGTASGAQTINVSGHPGSSTCDTTIATGKGFTVVI